MTEAVLLLREGKQAATEAVFLLRDLSFMLLSLDFSVELPPVAGSQMSLSQPVVAPESGSSAH